MLHPKVMGVNELETVADIQNMLRGIFELADKGIDSLGNPTGEAGDSVLSRAELGARVDPVLRDWLLEDVRSSVMHLPPFLCFLLLLLVFFNFVCIEAHAFFSFLGFVKIAAEGMVHRRSVHRRAA